MSKAAITGSSLDATNPVATNPVATNPVASFDQVVEGNIDIKQLSKKKYKITFKKIGKFLKYQSWSDTSKTLNENRSVYYQNAKQWIQRFNSLNASLKLSDKPLFRPSTVMEICSKKYMFVIYEAKLNSKDRIIFKASTEEIKLSPGTSKKLLKLSHGHHDGVRFDIDATPSLPQYVLQIPKNTAFSSCTPQYNPNLYIQIPIPEYTDQYVIIYVFQPFLNSNQITPGQITVMEIFGINVAVTYSQNSSDTVWYEYNLDPSLTTTVSNNIISASNSNQYINSGYANYTICGLISFINA